MRITILISSALVDEETGRMAGLAETVTCGKDRGEFLVSIGAAKAVMDEAKEEPKAEAKKAPAPAAKPAAKPVTK